MLKSGRPLNEDESVYDGVYVGVVTNNHDPENWGRIKVVYPWTDNSTESHWARLATLYAGKDRGSYFVPEVGDEVLMVFEHGDPNRPYVVGSLWNGQDPLPEPGHPDGEDNHKILETRSGHKMTFDDTDGAEFITLVDSSMNNRVVIDVAGDSISILALTGDIHINAPAGSVNFTSKTLNVKVEKTKEHTSLQTHDITVKSQNYDETVEKTYALTVGSKTVRNQESVAIAASSQLTTTGGQAEISIDEGAAAVMKGPVTQTVGSASVSGDLVMDSSPLKTWTIGSISASGKGTASLDGGMMTIMGGMVDVGAKQGQLALLGSPMIHLGGLINLKGDQVAFKPGG